MQARDAANVRPSPLPALGKRVVGQLFIERHESPYSRSMARASIRDARLWVRLFGKTSVLLHRSAEEYRG